ncbi:hypothetical protein [Streptomyces sp. 1222.5]|uniref:hypothetical protein n=1 Tax=Streptomyces sp. 1222.5 TaxID=1881026 RepID=UPI003EB81A0E
MGLFSRRAQTSRDYPVAGASFTGRADRFRRAKTTGARKAADAAEKWEQQDYARFARRHRWSR